MWAGCLQVLEGEGGEGARTERGGEESWVPKMKKDFENAKELLTEH